MKLIIGIALGGFIAFALYKKYYSSPANPLAPANSSGTSSATSIPNTLQAFYTAMAAGQIKSLASDPMGIYAADGVTKIGYYTADGSIYDMKGNLISQGLGGISITHKLSF